MMLSIIKYFNSKNPLSPDLQNYLWKVVKRKELAARQYLLREREVCQQLFFVEKGLLRAFYLREDKEISAWFAKEGESCTSIGSFNRQLPGEEYIQAIEKTELYCLHYQDLQAAYILFPAFNQNMRMVMEENYLLNEQRLQALRLQRCLDRYTWITHATPDLLQRVPAKFLASYLGMTEVTFSITRSKRQMREAH